MDKLRGGVASRPKAENGLSSIKSPAIYGRVYTCCAHQRVDVAISFKVIRGYGLNASRAELITTRDIAKGDVVAVFGKTATLWTSKEVH